MLKKIFISYSHDSKEHKEKVRLLSDRLRSDGLGCFIDQYINGFPSEGWLRWMQNQVDNSDFVIVICTPMYLSRYKGLDSEAGRGVNFEGVIISQNLYHYHHLNTKFIPVIFDNGSIDDVPSPLMAYGVINLPSEYEKLYRVLTNQPENLPPKLGGLKNLNEKKLIYFDSICKKSIGFIKEKKESQKYFPLRIIVSIAFLSSLIIFIPSCNETSDKCSSIINGDINGDLFFNCNDN